MTYATHNVQTTTKTVGFPPTPPEAHPQAGVENKRKVTRRSSVKKDLKQDITNQIIELMEAGPGKWKQTWAAAANNGMPVNATTGKPYRGINVVLLWMAGVEAGYPTNKWMTFKQAQAVGANVRKGEKSVACVFFDMIKKKDAQEGEDEFFPMAKAFHLFNVAQIENLPSEMLTTDMTPPAFSPDELAEMFIRDTEAVIEHHGSRAFYSPKHDKIVLPMPEAFTTPANYYATAAHELTHWTGHKSRLDRDFSKNTRFGDESYAFEELVAELGAAFVCGLFGFVDATVENHASYMASWIKVLKNDKNAIFTAASQAGKAFDYLVELTGITPQDQ